MFSEPSERLLMEKNVSHQQNVPVVTEQNVSHLQNVPLVTKENVSQQENVPERQSAYRALINQIGDCTRIPGN